MFELPKIFFKERFPHYTDDSNALIRDWRGFRFIASVVGDEHAGKPDENDCGFWPSRDPQASGYCGEVSDARFAKLEAHAKHIMYTWEAGEWGYVGIHLMVIHDGEDIAHESLWGLECNYPQLDRRHNANTYLYEVANELAHKAWSGARQNFVTAAQCAAYRRPKLKTHAVQRLAKRMGVPCVNI